MSLPTELLINIVTIVLLDYLEDIMPDPALIRNFMSGGPRFPPNATPERVREVAAEFINDNQFSMVGPYDDNYFIPLLQTSYQIREVALSVLSNVLHITRSNGRLCVRPWPCIRRVMSLYANPKCTMTDVDNASNGSAILYIYGIVACSEWSTWTVLERSEFQIADKLIDDKIMVALNAILLLENVNRRLLSRVAISCSHSIFSPIVRKVTYSIERLLASRNRLELRHFPEAYVTEIEATQAEIDAAILVGLEEIRRLYIQVGLVQLLWNLKLSPDVVAEIGKKLCYETLQPTILKVINGTRESPKYEACRQCAIEISAFRRDHPIFRNI